MSKEAAERVARLLQNSLKSDDNTIPSNVIEVRGDLVTIKPGQGFTDSFEQEELTNNLKELGIELVDTETTNISGREYKTISLRPTKDVASYKEPNSNRDELMQDAAGHLRRAYEISEKSYAQDMEALVEKTAETTPSSEVTVKTSGLDQSYTNIAGSGVINNAKETLIPLVRVTPEQLVEETIARSKSKKTQTKLVTSERTDEFAATADLAQPQINTKPIGVTDKAEQLTSLSQIPSVEYSTNELLSGAKQSSPIDTGLTGILTDNSKQKLNIPASELENLPSDKNFISAIQQGKTDRALSMLQENPLLIHAREKEQYSALSVAVFNQSKDVAIALTENGAEIDDASKKLMLDRKWVDDKFLQQQEASKQQLAKNNENDLTPQAGKTGVNVPGRLFKSVIAAPAAAMAFLGNNMVTTNTKTKETDAKHKMDNAPANIDTKDTKEQSAKNEADKIVEETKSGNNDLFAAIKSGNIDLIKKIIKDSPELMKEKKDGQTVVAWALENNQYKVATLLLKKGAPTDPESRELINGIVKTNIDGKNKDITALQDAWVDAIGDNLAKTADKENKGMLEVAAEQEQAYEQKKKDAEPRILAKKDKPWHWTDLLKNGFVLGLGAAMAALVASGASGLPGMMLAAAIGIPTGIFGSRALNKSHGMSDEQIMAMDTSGGLKAQDGKAHVMNLATRSGKMDALEASDLQSFDAFKSNEEAMRGVHWIAEKLGKQVIDGKVDVSGEDMHKVDALLPQLLNNKEQEHGH